MPVRPALVALALSIGFAVSFPSAKADDDYTTAQLVSDCSANPHSCQMQIGLGVVLGTTGSCVPTSLEVASDAQILQVMDWLRAHPDVHPDDASAAVDEALSEIYPCAK